MFSKAFGLSAQYIAGGRATTHYRSFATQIETTVIRYKEFGKPADVLKVEKESISGDLQPNEVLVTLEAAPINPADINIIEGVYGTKPTLPAIGGLEGVGKITAVGSNVKDLHVNDRVIPAQPGFGTWRTHAITSSDKLIKVPSDIPKLYAAVLSVNPSTAYRLLTDFGNLKAGDSIIQNAGNSTVGQAVIQIAKARGIKTISLIRDREDPNAYQSLVNELKSLGADIVVSESFARTPDFRKSISDIPKPKVAFNAVGGQSATEIARNLADGGTIVTYGAMGRQPVSLPNSLLIFRDIKSRGFWLTKWVQEHSKVERETMINELAELVRNRKLKLYLEAFRLSDFEHALKKSNEPFRNRKVVLEYTDPEPVISDSNPAQKSASRQ